MKKIILVLGIIILGIGCNSGQKQVENATNKLVDKLTAVCGLTPDEVNRIKPLVKNFITTKKENADKLASQQEALKIANQLNRTNLIDSLKTIFTPDQFEKFKAFTAQQKAKKQTEQGSDEGNGGQE